MSKIAIVGTGFIGRAWAISFARAGHDVALLILAAFFLDDDEEGQETQPAARTPSDPIWRHASGGLMPY
jgi:3-hydroxyacyl-CoA dehydrogenase